MCYRFLALASQSLSIIFELIPYVRETFRRHLSQKQAVMLVEFDKLKRVRGTLLVEILYSPPLLDPLRTIKSIRTRSIPSS